MLLETVINHFLLDETENVVMEKALLIADTVEAISPEIKLRCIDDARSAAFFALGLSQKLDKPVMLVIDEASLPNTYTALTEAWFQKRPLIVICLGDSILNKNIEYLKNCTGARIKLQNEKDLIDCITRQKKQTLPMVLLLEEKFKKHNENRKFDVTGLMDCLGEKDKCFVYESILPDGYIDDRITEVCEKHKYGMISKYMGYCIGSAEKCVLVTNFESVKLDMNIFNNRYMSEKFKLVLVNADDTAAVGKWLGSNKIDIIKAENPGSTEYKAFIETKRPVVLIECRQKEAR